MSFYAAVFASFRFPLQASAKGHESVALRKRRAEDHRRSAEPSGLALIYTVCDLPGVDRFGKERVVDMAFGPMGRSRFGASHVKAFELNKEVSCA